MQPLELEAIPRSFKGSTGATETFTPRVYLNENSQLSKKRGEILPNTPGDMSQGI